MFTAVASPSLLGSRSHLKRSRAKPTQAPRRNAFALQLKSLLLFVEAIRHEMFPAEEDKQHHQQYREHLLPEIR